MSEYPEQIRRGVVLSVENLARHVERLERLESQVLRLRDFPLEALSERELTLVRALAAVPVERGAIDE